MEKSRRNRDEENRNQSNKSYFRSLNRFRIFSLNESTVATDLEELITRADETSYITINTESDTWSNRAALMQIELIDEYASIVVIVQVHYLPSDRKSAQFILIKTFFNHLLLMGKTFYGWGDLKKKLEPFANYDLFNVLLLNELNFVDIQFQFDRWLNPFDGNRQRENRKWSLQDAVNESFEESLDQHEMINRWSRALFHSGVHTPIDSKANSMVYCAANDCLAVTKIAHLIDFWYVSNMIR